MTVTTYDVIKYLYDMMTKRPNQLNKIMFREGYSESNKRELCDEIEKRYKRMTKLEKVYKNTVKRNYLKSFNTRSTRKK